MFFIQIFLFLSSAWSQEVQLPPIQIQSHNDALATSRSVEWPVVIEKPKAAINLPQPDDTLNAFNGLQVRTQGSPTFSIRGSAQSGRALVLYDHIPLNFASGFGAPRIFLAKETLDQVLLVKGPASLFYGSQAMSGAVDFIPRKYRESELNINFSDTDESFLPGRGSLAHQSYQLATPLYQSKKTHMQSSVFYEDDDGQFPFQGRNQSGIRQFNSQNLARGTFSSETQWNNIHLKFNALGGQQIIQSPGPTNFVRLTRQETKGGLFSVTPHIFFNDETSLRSRLSYLKSDSEFFENNVTTYSNQETTILQNEWIYDFDRHTKLQFFADFFFHELDSSFAGDNLKQDNTEIGPFLSFKSLDSLTHQVGGRFLVRNEKLLPTASTHWITSMADTWVSYSQGFRNPTLFDLFANDPTFVGNPNLVAESSEQVELGIKKPYLSHGLQWDLRFFHIEYDEFIESREQTPGVFTRLNQGSGFSRGLDLDLGWHWAFLKFDMNYNYLDTKNRSENRSFRISPRHQLALNGSYDWKNYLFQVQNIHWYKAFDVIGNQAVELEDWQQWNFYIHWQALKKTRVSLGLVNAFNEAKELTLNYPEPQRKYWIQLQQRF